MKDDMTTWSEGDLLRLIAEQEKESLTLDYKRSAALSRSDRDRAELSKDVSAMANSAGGVLIYGIAEQNNLPTGLDGGVDPAMTTREALEDSIHGRVHPRVDGLRIKAIDLATQSPGHVAYVMQMPQSLRAPHMAADHRYHKRVNFMCLPIEDYEVRDVMRRHETPALNLRLSLPAAILRLPDSFPTSEPAEVPITAIIANDGPAPANVALIRIWIDVGLDIVEIPSGFRLDDNDQHFFNAAHAFYGPIGRFRARQITYEWMGNTRLPVWLGTPQTLALLRVRLARAVRAYRLRWQIDAPGMVPSEATYTLACIGSVVELALPHEPLTIA